MKGVFLSFCLLLLSGALGAYGQSFSFYSTLRAGLPAGGDWELGLGNTSSASSSTANVSFTNGGPGQNWWNPNASQAFRIGWNATTNSAYATVFGAGAVSQTVNFANAGAPLSSNAIWTLPAASFFVSAATRPSPSSVEITGLTLSPNTVLASGSLPSLFRASQPIVNPGDNFQSLNAPLVINAASNGGNWFIQGNIRFNGLAGQGGSSQRSQLQFNILATGSDVPEPLSTSLVGAGLFALLFWRRRQRVEVMRQ